MTVRPIAFCIFLCALPACGRTEEERYESARAEARRTLAESLIARADERMAQRSAEVLNRPADYVGTISSIADVGDGRGSRRITVRYEPAAKDPGIGRRTITFAVRGHGAVLRQDGTILPLDSLRPEDRVAVWLREGTVVQPVDPPVVSVDAVQRLEPAADSSSGATGALALIRAYYDAVNARDYAGAYAAWGAAGPPGRPTLETFAAGYRDTDSVQVELGPPGRLEGAAGSRYVAVPVEIRAFTRGGPPARYTGSYTVRRSVVPGADSASRRWHLYRATLEPVGSR